MNGNLSARSWMGALLAAASLTAMGAGNVNAEDRAAAVIKGRMIGYAMSEKFLGVYQTKDGKSECPNGLNDGPREEFKILFPDDGTKRKLIDTQLAREGEVWDPRTTKEPLGFREAQGKIGIGLNLDGKIGPNDFTSPDGEKGVDNQLYRVIGCIANHRGPDGTNYHFVNTYMQKYDYNRTMIELTNVDSLVNDNDVTVTIYRGRDPLLSDATGENILPGGTLRVDYRWGKKFIQTMHGKIVDGVLTTDPAEVALPESTSRGVPILHVHGWRVRLKLMPDSAEGLMAGYMDIDDFHFALATNWSTHHRSYGQESLPSEYRAMRRLADGAPDPKTGENTAISAAWQVKFTQAFIQHAPKETSENAPIAQSRAARH